MGFTENLVLNYLNQIKDDYSSLVSAVTSVLSLLPLATRGVDHVVEEFALTSYVAHSHGIKKCVYFTQIY